MSNRFPLPWPVYILAGGRSSRLGYDKARAVLHDDKTLIETVVDSLRGAFSSFTVVADKPHKFDDLGLRTIADERSHLGPLSGVLGACEDAESEYIFIASCDRIGLELSWIDLLYDALDSAPRAVSFVDDGRREPLFSFWRSDLAPLIRRRLDAGHRALWQFLEEIDAVAIDAPKEWKYTFSINRPEDLRRARRILGNTDPDDLTSGECD